jgi:hypothetical protein
MLDGKEAAVAVQSSATSALLGVLIDGAIKDTVADDGAFSVVGGAAVEIAAEAVRAADACEARVWSSWWGR